jgi:hypothetical protein
MGFSFLIPPDFVGGLKDETRSAESATDNSQGETPGKVAKLMRALKGRKRFLPPFQGLDQILYFPYYLSRFQRSESHLSNHPQNPAGSGKLKTIHAGVKKPLERRAGKSVKEIREGESQ